MYLVRARGLFTSSHIAVIGKGLWCQRGYGLPTCWSWQQVHQAELRDTLDLAASFGELGFGVIFDPPIEAAGLDRCSAAIAHGR